MLTTERKALILSVLHAEGRIVAKEISRQLGLSEDTIRRDLRELAGEGLLKRVHGGALPASPALANLGTRRDVSADDKAAIAKAAAKLVRNGQTVFLDGGTSAVAVAKSLPQDLRAIVVTHSPDIVMALLDKPAVEIELIGGRVYKHSNVATGTIAVESIGSIRPDVFFMGVTGIHAEYGLTTGDREEAAIKREVCHRAGETFVLASREKLGAVSTFGVVGLDDIDGIIVDKRAAGAEIDALMSRGISVIRS